MSKNKKQEKKEFLISKRKKAGPGFSNAPVWVTQKSKKRIWNKRQKRHWLETEFGAEYNKLERKKKVIVKSTVKGKKKPKVRRQKKKGKKK
ncbi:MAG: hypothetical protein ABH821_04965 [archaeon]